MSVTDNQYVADEQQSIAKIYLLRLKAGMKLGNRELIEHFYKKNIALWFRAFRNGHRGNCDLVESGLDELLKEQNRSVFRKVKYIFTLCKFLNVASHKLKTYLESQSKNINAIDP